MLAELYPVGNGRLGARLFAVARPSPVRLVVALSVAAALAIFLLYVSVAGGTPSIQPSQLHGRKGEVALVGKVTGSPAGDAHSDGLRFRIRDVSGATSVPVVYTGSVPDLFKVGREVRVEGKLRDGVFVAKRDSLRTKCPSKYTTKKIDLMPELGRAALVLCLGLALYALVAGGYAAAARKRRLARSAQNALFAAFASTVVAAIVLLAALLRHDFSFTYVAEHTSRRLPTPYTISAFWGGQEGSLLLWLLVLTGLSALAVGLARRSAADLVAWVVPVLALVASFFAFMLVAVSSPFATQVAPTDGAGLNPSLQNPYMMIHPPCLYLGYVGLTIPFAFAMGALFARRADELWIVLTRRWTLFAWTALGIGQLLGAHWAYVEVGWGGYYAWDPVENAALMPWLAATAFLHSVMIQEKRGMLKVWNVLLVTLAFCLALFGTFLTRSGVVSSIHSFTQSPLGGWFLGFICVIAIGSLALILNRLPLLRSKTRMESLVSREATFLYNNLLLVALCLTILWGVIFPILTEAVRGEQITVSGPYYNFFLRVFGLPLLLLMGIGPLVAWRRASLAVARAELRVAGGDRARGGARPAPARSRLVLDRLARLHVRRVRAGLDRLRVRTRDPGAPRAHGRAVARGVLGARRAQPAPIRRLHRPRGGRAPRDRRRRLERLRQGLRADAVGRPVDVDRPLRPYVQQARAAPGRERHASSARCSMSARTGTGSARSSRARTRIPRSSRRRTRSASAPTT